MRIVLGAPVVVALLFLTVVFAYGYGELSRVEISGTSSMAVIKAFEVDSFSPIRGGTGTAPLDALFAVESIHPDHDERLRLAFYILNPDQQKDNFRFAHLNVSVWYYDIAGEETYSGESRILNIETRAYAILFPRVDLSASAWNQTYILKGALVFGAGAKPAPTENPFVFRLEAY